jgi:hypothetical protein
LSALDPGRTSAPTMTSLRNYKIADKQSPRPFSLGLRSGRRIRSSPYCRTATAPTQTRFRSEGRNPLCEETSADETEGLPRPGRATARRQRPLPGAGHQCVTGRAACDIAGTGPLLGDRLRLAHVRSQIERAAVVRDRDRRDGHPVRQPVRPRRHHRHPVGRAGARATSWRVTGI